jgi:hypothetical protein
VSELTISEVLTTVKYDRSLRAWQAVNGRVWSFPGPDGQRQAQLYAIDHDRPDIAAEVQAIMANNQAHPAYEGITRRAIKAGFIVRDGHVLPPRPLEAEGSYLHEVARVRSQSKTWPDGSPVEYAVCVSPEGQSCCECEDWHNGHTLDILADYYRLFPHDPHRPRSGAPKLANGDYGCKHILAVLMVAALTVEVAQ